MSGPAQARYTMVVLAGARPDRDPVADAAGVPSKALAPISGRAMVLRVLDALRDSSAAGPVLLCGPKRADLAHCDELASLVERREIDWVEPADSPVMSLARALRRIPAGRQVMVTTADHALLDSSWVDFFCASSSTAGTDLVAAVVSHGDVLAAFPGTQRTPLRLRRETLCSCNLFALLTPAGREAMHFWARVDVVRKRPWQIARLFGWGTVVRYAVGMLPLDEALRAFEHRAGASASIVRMPFPAAAIDVDTPEDLSLVQANFLKGATPSTRTEYGDQAATSLEPVRYPQGR